MLHVARTPVNTAAIPKVKMLFLIIVSSSYFVSYLATRFNMN